MRFSSRLVACVIGGGIAFFLFWLWHDHRVTAYCALHADRPCRVPADFFVLVAPVVTLLGAFIALVGEELAHRRTARRAAR